MSEKEILSYKIGFIGGGNMCKAIVNGLITNSKLIKIKCIVYIHALNMC